LQLQSNVGLVAAIGDSPTRRLAEHSPAQVSRIC
jgi:hypothetical protein